MADIEDSGSSAVPLQSAEDVLSSLFSKGSYASVGHRTQLFNENFPLLLSLDVTPELVDDIAIAFTSTAGTYVDKKSRKLVDGALLAVLRSPLKTAVVEKLVAIFQRLSNALARKKSLQHPPYVLSFLRWSCLILKNYDLDAVKAVLNQIISFHAAVFETLSENSSSKFWATATHYLSSALRKVSPDIARSYVDKLFVDSASSLALISVLISTGFLDSVPEKKAVITEYYKQQLLSGPKNNVIFSGFSHFVASLDEVTLSDVLIPHIDRLTKRTPEIIIPLLKSVLEGISLDLSPFVLKFQRVISPSFAAASDSLREDAASASAVLLSRCTDPNELQALIQLLLNEISAKPIRIPVKIAALSSIVQADFSKAPHAPLEFLVTEFLKITEKEENEQFLVPQWSVIGKASAVTGSFPNALETVIKAVIAKDKIRDFALEGLAAALSNPAARPRAASLLDTLSKLSAGPANTTAKRNQVISALRSLIYLRQDGNAPLVSLISDLLGPNSFLYNEAYFSKLVTPAENLRLLSLVKVVLENSRDLLAPIDLENNFFGIYSVIQFLGLHPDSQVRKATHQLLKTICVADPQLSSELLLVFSQSVFSSSPLLAAVSPQTLRAYLADIVGPQLRRPLLPTLLLMSHYPSLFDEETLNKAASQLNFSLALFKKTQGLAFVRDQHNAADIVSAVLERDLLHTNDKNVKVTIISAISSLLKLAKETGDVYFQRLVSLSKQWLNDAPSLALSEVEVGVFETPEGEIFYADDEPMPLQVSDRPRGEAKKGKDSWEDEIRKELDRKKGKKEEEQIDPKLLQKLNEQSVIRERVVKLANSYRAAFELISYLTTFNSSFVLRYFPIFYQRILKLVVSPIVSSEATQTIYNLSAVVPFVGGPFVNGVVQRMAVVSICNMLKKESTKDEINEASTFVSNSVFKYVKNKALNGIHPSGFTLIFPLLERSVFKPQSFIAQDEALFLIKKHINAHDFLPRGGMVRSLIHLIINANRLTDQAAEVLHSLCSGASDEDLLEEVLIGFFNENEIVRRSCFTGYGLSQLGHTQEFLTTRVHAALWASLSDPDAANKAIAEENWNRAAKNVDNELVDELIKMIQETNIFKQKQAARGLNGALKNLLDSGAAQNDLIKGIINRLISIFEANLPEVVAGNRVIYDTPQRISTRLGLAIAFGEIAKLTPATELENIFYFVIDSGSLRDPEDEVRQTMIDSGSQIVAHHGHEHAQELLKIFDDYLNDKSVAHDTITRESVVILLGRLASYLPAGDPRTNNVVSILIDSLSTPSMRVRKTCSECLTTLMGSLKPQAPELVQRMFDAIENSPVEKAIGAAFGLAGILKGLGLGAFKTYDVIPKLKAIVGSKKQSCKIAALRCFGCLSERFGRLFEPYIIHILEPILSSFSDAQEVHLAASESAKMIMSQLSPHGVKIVLPTLLKGLENDQWRTKKASIELLGSMAFCAPKQLGACLPLIVPSLAQTLREPHQKIHAAAMEALHHIGSVIRNPEIQRHVPTIIQSIDDPDKYNEDALNALLETKFIHVIDSPSLALIMPLLEKALKDRQTKNKKKAAQIIGNLVTLSDHNDLVPYLPVIIPGIKATLVDMIPEVRTTSALALGRLIKAFGEEQFSEVIPWLLKELTSETARVNRSGAAQGLSQVLAGLDDKKLESILPSILRSATLNKNPCAREGSLGLFVYLPGCLQERIEKFMDQILSAVLQGFADEHESVRDIAVHSAQSLINQFAATSLEKLLHGLEEGLFNDNHRIRQISVQLLNDLLFRVASLNCEQEYEEAEKTRSSLKYLQRSLGTEKQQQVLAAIYITRFDQDIGVRQGALAIWKTAVINTRKTIKEILPILMQTIVSCLGSSNEEKRGVASRTLGDLTNKFGAFIIANVMPVLEESLKSSSQDIRQGACLGLSEILSQSQPSFIEPLQAVISEWIRKAICDESEDVRAAAATAFDQLTRLLGIEVISDILPHLLKEMEDESLASSRLSGLREVLQVRSSHILPHLLPQLLEPPLTEANCRALASVAEVSGQALERHLDRIFPALLPAVTTLESARFAAKAVVLSIHESGLHFLFMELFRPFKDEDSKIREAGVILVEHFCAESRLRFENNVPAILRNLLSLLDDSDGNVIATALRALDTLINKINKNDYGRYLDEVQTSLAALHDRLPEDKILPAFTLAKGLNPLLNLTLHCVRNGTPEIRQQAAMIIGKMVLMSSESGLKLAATNIIGAFIRVMADRFPSFVKEVILHTTGLLLFKAASHCKILCAQLQTTFVKALLENDKKVREEAATNLSLLMPYIAKAELLVADLLQQLSNPDDAVREGVLNALRMALSSKAVISPKALSVIEAKIPALILESNTELTRIAFSRFFGVYSSLADPATTEALIKGVVLKQVAEEDQFSRLRGLSALSEFIGHVKQISDETKAEVVTAVIDTSKDVRLPVAEAVAEAFVQIVRNRSVDFWSAFSRNLAQAIVSLFTISQASVRLPAVLAIKHLAKTRPLDAQQELSAFAMSLIGRARDNTQPSVKIAAERALLYLTQYKRNPQIATDFAARLAPAEAKIFNEFCQRILARLKDDSDSEE